MNDEARPPLLVLVSGPPASGKTTLARHLAEALRLPVLHRDAIKSGLAEPRGIADPAQGRTLAGPTFSLFFGTIGRFLDAGCSLVTEHAFMRSVSEPDVLPLVSHTRARAVIVHCHLPRDEIIRRAEARLHSGTRHASHPDQAIVDQMHAGTFPWNQFEPLDLGIPVLEVSTLHAYAPDIPTLASAIHRAAALITSVRPR